MAEIVVSVQRHCPYPPNVMWSVFADPEVSVTLDDRVTLVSSEGVPGTVGSAYDLVIQMGPMSVPQRVTVREATQSERLEAVTTVEGKAVAVQLAEFAATEQGTDVTWTVTQNAARPLAAVVRKKVGKELAPWLDAAEVAAQRLV